MKSFKNSHDDTDLIIDDDDDVKKQTYNNGMYFIDGLRRIDFVLVYQRKDDTKVNETKRYTFLKTLMKEGLDLEIQDDRGFVHPIIEGNKQLIVNVSETNSPSHQSNLVFVKISASWDTLCRYADIMKIRKPMLNLGVDYDFNRKTFFQRLFAKFDFLKVFNNDEAKLQPLPRGFTWPFSISKEYLFDIPDRTTFFNPAERSLVVNYILRRASYRHISDNCKLEYTELEMLEDMFEHGNNIEMKTLTDLEEVIEPQLDSTILINDEKLPTDGQPSNDNDPSIKRSMDFGIAKLISDKVFESAYILHEPTKKPLIEDDGNQGIVDNQRNLLYKNWVMMRNIFRIQPLDHIRLYYGEKVAFYFAWLGYYTYWLLPVSILGVVITIYNLAFTPNDPVLNEIKKGVNITMCPLTCTKRQCKLWLLSQAYNRFFIIRILDNGATVVLAVVMSIWASLFLEMWKRQQNKLAYHWNVHDMEYENEPPRPEFVALIDKKYSRKTNPITGEDEPFIPFWRQRVPIMFFTYSTVLLSIIMALALLAGIILYKLVTLPLLMNSNSISLTQSSIITAATASMMSLIIIMTLTLVYSRVAEWLTNIEHHRTQSQYDSSVTLKLYFLEFINNYSSIFYIGFVQQYTQPMPKSYNTSTSGLKPKGCPAGGCLLDLSMQLVFIMVGKQIISHIKEYSIPRIVSWLKKVNIEKTDKNITFKKESDLEAICDDEVAIKNDKVKLTENIHKVKPELVRCYADNLLLDPGPRPLFGEYLEMLIQFGFITIFIPAFPLAPLLALINNLLEIRGDALKFVRHLRRPIAHRVKDIGIWISILAIVAQIAVKSNAILIAFGTTYIERLVYKIGHSLDGTLDGFVDFSMSYMNTSEFKLTKFKYNSTICRYMGYRYPPENENYTEYTSVFWQILAFKVIFVYVFENLVSLFMTTISVLIPDVPLKLRIMMKREAVLTNEIILKAELLRNKNQNASKMVAESFKKSAIISKKLKSKSKPNRASDILKKATKISRTDEKV